MNTQELVDKISKAISFKYNEDGSSPGLQVSFLTKGPNKGKFYASIVRYGKAFGKDKAVLCASTSPVLDDALKDVAVKFLSIDPAPETRKTK
jgi:hypothetical protein